MTPHIPPTSASHLTVGPCVLARVISSGTAEEINYRRFGSPRKMGSVVPETSAEGGGQVSWESNLTGDTSVQSSLKGFFPRPPNHLWELGGLVRKSPPYHLPGGWGFDHLNLPGEPCRPFLRLRFPLPAATELHAEHHRPIPAADGRNGGLGFDVRWVSAFGGVVPRWCWKWGGGG